MCDNKFFANGTLYTGAAEVGATISHAETCYRCNGTGVVRPWGVCFACGGNKVHIKRRKIYSQADLDKKDAKKAAKEEKKQEAIRQSKTNCINAIEGASVAMLKAQLIISTGNVNNINSIARKIEFLRSLTEDNRQWTEKRVELIIKTVDSFNSLDNKIRDQKKTEEELRKDPKNWIHSGRYEITGTVLSVKEKESQWGFVLKMLVQDEIGRKFWSSVPKRLILREEDRNVRVKFTASIKQSDDDPIFGFCSRPAKGSLIGEMHSEEDAHC